MARSRAIKDEFFDSEQLAKVCRDARLLFVGLWLMADHWGVLRNLPTKIKAGVFPFDDESSPFAVSETQFREWLEDLFRLRFILRFEYRGRRYIYIRSWEDHQTIQHREKQKHNATIPPDKLAEIVAGLLAENQPPLPNLAPSDRQNGNPIPNESGTNPDQVRNGSGSDTELSQGKVTVREGKGREGGQSPGNSARVPIGEVKKSKEQEREEDDAIRRIKGMEGMLKRFKDCMSRQKNSWAYEADWKEKKFKSPGIRKLAVEFIESEQERETDRKAEDEAVRMLESTESSLGRFKEFLNKHKDHKKLKKVWHDQRFQAPVIRALALEFMELEQEPEAVNDQEKEPETKGQAK